MAPWVASLIFLGMLVLVFSEKLNRSLAAILASASMVLAGRLLGFYNEDMAAAAIDLGTLGLLLGMMTLVALLEPTGFFEYLAIWTGRFSGGQPRRLLILLGTVTTLLSMFLDNVTTVVLIAPVTIMICEILGLSPLPYLVAAALLSNTGGVATLIGDPPNVIIAEAAGLSFNSFLTHTLPVVVIAWLASLFLLLHLFRRELSAQPSNLEVLLAIDPDQALSDKGAARKVLGVLGGVLGLFFLQNRLQLSPQLIALGGAAVALLLVRPRLHEVLLRVEWEVLLFFVALFVTVGGLEASGVLHSLVGVLHDISYIPASIFGVLVLWFSAALSAVVDNVPVTIAMAPVIEELGQTGVPVMPLWWALSFGTGFGGNATIIGATTNIIIAGMLQKTRTPLTTALWTRRGLPVMLLTCAIASLFFLLFFPVFQQ